MHEQFRGRRMVVTGASSGIGRALVLALVRQGAAVAACARRAPELQGLEREAGGGPGRLVTRRCDVGEAPACQELVAAALAELGGVDVLVNNAAILGPLATVRDYPIEAFEEVMRINLLGAFYMTRAALPSLLGAAPGLVINVSSGLGHFGQREVSAYCASKFALEGFTQALADEHPGSQLIVLAVSPGMAATPMLRSYLDGGEVAAYTPPERIAEGFMAILAQARPEWTGRSLEIERFLA